MYDEHLETGEVFKNLESQIEDYIEGNGTLELDEIADNVQNAYEDDEIKSSEYDNLISMLEELGLELSE